MFRAYFSALLTFNHVRKPLVRPWSVVFGIFAEIGNWIIREKTLIYGPFIDFSFIFDKHFSTNKDGTSIILLGPFVGFRGVYPLIIRLILCNYTIL